MKTALILHGWPQRISNTHPLYRLLDKLSFKVISPYLFAKEVKFNPEKIQEYIEKILKYKNPDLIVGVSLGGLIAPYIALCYPKSKLVLIATGPYLRSDNKTFKWFVKLAKSKYYLKAFSFLNYLPKGVRIMFYKLVNPHKGGDANDFNGDMEKNIEEIKKIPLTKQIEILKFITSVNNTKIMEELKNKTLVICGRNDKLMPLSLSRKMCNLIDESTLYISGGEHYSTLNKGAFDGIKGFVLQRALKRKSST